MRAKWVPVFVNHVFSAGMTNSQRAETRHGFFKRYVSKRNSLVDFIICFNRAISHQRHEELIVDHVDINEKPKLKLPHEMESRMAEIYTHKIFYEFQDEFWESFFYNVELVTESGSCVYKVYRINKSGCRGREIVYEKESDYATCNCKKFKSEGIPCRHLLAYFVKMGISFLPQKYILKRWTKTATYERVVDDLGIEINYFSDNSFISRRTRLFQLASNVIESAAFNDKDSKIVEDGLSDLLRRFKKDKAITSCGSINDRNSTKEQVYNEPPTVQAEECGERLKDGKEKACDPTKVKGRQCNGCGKVEHDHDKRNCPTLKNRSSVDANEDSNLLDLNNGILPQ
ncbi:hypothetical protein Ddye_022297 [Dipteronia dyeriana]|uniref:Protein FAR1-RELATED SEQUENCE n=1 Tax=Dipteronia dyeriana TaxID=168575 RepID=A0AAD9WYI1_9ROSI|nr:hypothetical protein Ddye_022297 [Dipteronia dyeriana]